MRVRWLPVLLVAALAVASCSSDATGGGDATGSTVATASDVAVEPSFLFVVPAASGTAADGVLTLAVADGPVVTVFSDRPLRLAYRSTVEDLVAGWETSFGDDPPNAELLATVDGTDQESVLELTDPSLSDGTLTFAYRVVDGGTGGPPAEFTSAHLFIDPGNGGDGGTGGAGGIIDGGGGRGGDGGTGGIIDGGGGPGGE